MKYLRRIPPVDDDYKFIRKELNVKDDELCYLISNYSDIDGKILSFSKAFEKVYGRGFGSIIITLSADKLYLETEIGYGKQNRFIGKHK